MKRDCQQESDDRFLRLLMSCGAGDLVEIDYDDGYYVGQLVRVGEHHITVASHGKRPERASGAMAPQCVYGVKLPVGCVIGFENRGRHYARIPKVSAL